MPRKLVLLVCALLLCLAAASPQPASAQTLCLDLEGFPGGRQQLSVGEELDYTLAVPTPGATEQAPTLNPGATINWGNNKQSKSEVSVPPGGEVVLGPNSYDRSGTFRVTLEGVSGVFPDGTGCANPRFSVGTVVVAASGSAAGGPPSVAAAKRKCIDFLKGSGRFKRVMRRGTNISTACGAARGDSRDCTVTLRDPKCGCRVKIRARVKGKGKPRVRGCQRVGSRRPCPR